MATFEEKAERLKKELEEAANSNQRRNLSREYELTLRLLRIIRAEVFTLDDINKCRLEIMREYPEYRIDFGMQNGRICVVHPSNFIEYEGKNGQEV